MVQWLASLGSDYGLPPLCVLESHQWQCCLNMTLAGERDITPQL